MTWGVGYLIGIAIAVLLYFAVRYVERDYYKRKQEIIRKKLERVAESKRSNGEERAAGTNDKNRG